MHSDCKLVSRDCCGGEPRSLDNVYATRRDSEDAKDPRSPACRSKISDCSDYEQVGFHPLGPQVRAACIAGECTAIDLRQDDASACRQDSDCRSAPAACCAPCEAWTLSTYVAIGTHADPTLLACFPVPSCPECAAPLPESYCAPDGHCALRNWRPDGGV